MKFKKRKEVKSLTVLSDNCVGCGKCVKKCKMEVFAMEKKRAKVVNFDNCVGCGKCVKKMCNFEAIVLKLA